MFEPEADAVGEEGRGGADAEGFHAAEEPVLVDEAAFNLYAVICMPGIPLLPTRPVEQEVLDLLDADA